MNLPDTKDEPVQNPYNNRKMLPHDSDMFFGRESEIRQITDSLMKANPESVSIVGERRIGKSSLANRIFHKIRADEKMIAVFLDCDGLENTCTTRENFFLVLAEKFSEFQERFDGYYGDKLFRDYISFRNFIKKEAANGFRFAVFIDEFETLPEQAFADDSFFSNLRFLANGPNYHLAFVTVSCKSLKEMTHKDIQSSGFWNIFSTKIIGLLDEKTATDLRVYGFKKAGFSLEEDEHEACIEYAGEFPFFIQLVCDHIFDAKYSKEEWDRDNTEFKLLEYYENIWENRNNYDQKILKNLVSGDKIQAVFDLKKLKMRGILKNKNGDYYPFSEYFSTLLRTHLKTEKAIEKTENRMKIFISYATEDFETANRIYSDLKQKHVSPWLDRHDLLPGQNWKFAIRQAIKTSDYYLILLSSKSVSKRGFVQKEMRMALDILDEIPESGSFIIPVRLNECEPLDERLQNIHTVDMFPSYEDGLNQLLRVFCPASTNNNIPAPATTSPATLFDPSRKIRILFMEANPVDTGKLRLDEEFREIKNRIQQSEFRDRFELVCEWAVRVDDIMRCLMSHKPDIVHFSGHGEYGEILLENNDGTAYAVPAGALSKLFSLLKDNIRCVVLNACYTEPQAKSISEHIDYVVGMSTAIKDKAAINFASSFYQALGFGRDIETAFDLGCLQIEMKGLNEQDTPKLLKRP